MVRDEISTSYVERQTKKVENLAHVARLHYMHYNFAHPRQLLILLREDGRKVKRTPAMAAGVADHPWGLTKIAGLLD